MEKIADLLTKFMISESSSENLDYEVCKFGLLMAIEVAINTVIALCISFLLGMFRYGILFLTFFSLLRAFAGGVHLERFWSCTVLSGMVLSMVLLIAKYAVMKKTWMLLYEQYTDDKLSREDFLLKRRSTMKKQPDWRKG